MSSPDVPEPIAPTEPTDLAIRRSWWVLAGSFALLGLLTAARIVAGATLLDWVAAVLLVAAGAAVVVHRRAVVALSAGRRDEAETFARILQRLSRSISPDAIVDAIVDELGIATGADHLVVVRRTPGTRLLEATLVSRRPGVPSSRTLVPFSDLEEVEAVGSVVRHRPGGEAAGIGHGSAANGHGSAANGHGSAFAARRPRGGQAVAERLATRVGSLYGLKHVVASPLETDEGPIGAIVLSRRTRGTWDPAARRLLAAAASEASAALTRADSLRTAEALASTDPLTGLPNRRYFDEFSALLARRRRADDAVGVLMIDIDRFKLLNDRRGHAAGDQVLRAVATAIVGAVREQDVPVRYGGEEFAVLLRNPSPAVAVEVAERVRTAVRSIDVGALGLERVTVSIGVAVGAGPGDSIDALVLRADDALYQAKDAGRDRVVAA